MRGALLVMSFCVIAAYLIGGRSQWFAELEHEAAVASEQPQVHPVELGTTAAVNWLVETSKYAEGRYRLSLAIDQPPNRPETPTDLAKLLLDVEVTATATTEDGREIRRDVENWYWKGNRPFRSGKHTWIRFGAGSIEYGLADIVAYPFEDLTIHVRILEPDPRVDAGKARLVFRREADDAVLHHMFLPRLIRDGGLAICLALAAGLVVLAWRQRRAEA